MRTIKSQQFAKATLRLVEVNGLYKVLTLSGGKIVATFDGPDGESLWHQAIAQVGRTSPGFWGYDDAKTRFRANFSAGFADPSYEVKERACKDAASLFIAEHVSLQAAQAATPEVCELANKAFAKTNMATPIEKTRIQALLRSDKGPAYLNAAVELATGDAATALSRLDRLMREHGQPSWPCATYLPFFWRTKTGMFLKPQVTKDFAERVGHRFVHEYDARLNGETYASLLDLASQCESELADLHPKDRIDVQSFIWVVGAYPDTRVSSA